MFDLDKLLQDNSSLDFFKLIEQLFFSIVLIGIVFGVRLFILIIIKRRLNNRSALLRWRLTSMYIALFCTLWLLLPLWISSLRGVLAILGIFGAGVLIVLKELILNIAGWFYIVLRRPFTMGNRIVINEMTGDVIEIRLLDFSMIEVNPRSEGGQSTGRIIHVPNSQLFTSALYNSSKEFSFNWNEIKVPLTPDSDWKKARGILLTIASKTLDQISEHDDRLKDSEELYAIRYTRLTPAVFVEYRNGAIILFLRHLTEPRQTRLITDSIWSEILTRFQKSKTINLFDGDV